MLQSHLHGAGEPNRLVRLDPGVADSVDLRSCLSSRFPADGDAAGPGTTF